MRFDSSRAWGEASRLVGANRDMLVALAGVFLVLPLTALAIFAPQPEPPAGASPEALLDMLGAHYKVYWPYYVATAVISTIGSLAIMALIADRNRPTVGQAIRQGTIGMPSVIIAQVLMGMVLALAVMVPVGIATATGVAALAVVATAAALLAAVWIWVRLSLLTPVVIVENKRNPLEALLRSWRLTRGNAGRLLAFYLLLLVAFLVVMWLIGMVLGLLVAAVLQGETGAAVNALVAGVLQSALSVYFVAVMAASHEQLAGNASPETFA